MALTSWSLASVTASTMTDLVTPDTGVAVAIIGISICNTDANSTANITVVRTNNANTIKSTIYKDVLVPGQTVFLDPRTVIKLSSTPDKIRVLSDVAAVSFDANGDQDTEE